jgi:transcriptional regulator with XRE-family HTH domain
MATAVPSDLPSHTPLGAQLREWRRRRHQSQLALALQAGVSQRHLSFVESGRSQPSREMVLHLAEQLEVPLRERNRMLVAAGFAPVFPERPLADPALAAARRAVERVLTAHEPFPALAIDRHWTLVAANRALAPLLAGVGAALLAPPVNVLRLSLHPEGLSSRIVNLTQWRAYLLQRLQRECEITGDATLGALLTELEDYPVPTSRRGSPPPHVLNVLHEDSRVFVPLQLETDAGVLSFIGTTTVFGTPVDVTVAEIALECFFPADEVTADYLHAARVP